MSFAAIRSGEHIPTYNGKNYPFWKDKMMRNLTAINPAGWEIVKDGVIIKDKKAITPDELKCMALDAEVRVFITNHLSAEKYLEVRNFASAKDAWDYLEKLGEGASTQKDARIDTLRSKFYRFARKDGEKVESTYNRLTTLCTELVSLGAPDITYHLVVRQLLRSLDESFENLVMMIKERSNYKNMTPADVLERLTTYELELEEKRDVNGNRRRSHALKAKASRHSSPEPGSASDVESDDPTGIGKDLALIVKRFQRFQRSSSSPKKSYSSRRSSSSSHRSSSRSSPAKDNNCYKCKKPGHYIADCPLWEVDHKSKHSHRDSSSRHHRSTKSTEFKRHESSSRRDKQKDSDDDKKNKKYHKKREGSSSKTHSSRRSSSHRAKAYLGKEMNSHSEASGSEAESGSRSGSGSGSESDGVAGLAFALADASTKASSSFFTNNSSEDETPAYRFMAKAKVSSSKASYDTSECSSYESDSKVSYAKLAKLASRQQDELDSLSKTIKKSEVLLIDEIDKGQTLTNEHESLKSFNRGMIFFQLIMISSHTNSFKGKWLLRI